MNVVNGFFTVLTGTTINNTTFTSLNDTITNITNTSFTGTNMNVANGFFTVLTGTTSNLTNSNITNIRTTTITGTNAFFGNMSISGTLKFLQAPSAGKVLTSDATGNATWQTGGTYAGPIFTALGTSSGGSVTSASVVAFGMGANDGFSYTPSKSGIVQLLIGGGMSNSSSSASLFYFHFGTGTPPNTGDAFTSGSYWGPLLTLSVIPGNPTVPFSANAVQSFTVGTPYWFDMGGQSVNDGSAILSTVSWQFIEF